MRSPLAPPLRAAAAARPSRLWALFAACLLALAVTYRPLRVLDGFGAVVVVPPAPGARHSATVVWLHGIGESGADWAPLAAALRGDLPHVKWLFPTAKLKPVEALGPATSAHAWFSVPRLDGAFFNAVLRGAPATNDTDAVKQALRLVRDVVADERAAGVPRSRVVVGGFSQGGAVALRAALGQTPPYAGVVLASSWVEPAALRERRAVASAANLATPILVRHGAADPTVPLPVARGGAAALRAAGCSNVALSERPGEGHWVRPAAAGDIGAWLAERLPPLPWDDLSAAAEAEAEGEDDEGDEPGDDEPLGGEDDEDDDDDP